MWWLLCSAGVSPEVCAPFPCSTVKTRTMTGSLVSENLEQQMRTEVWYWWALLKCWQKFVLRYLCGIYCSTIETINITDTLDLKVLEQQMRIEAWCWWAHPESWQKFFLRFLQGIYCSALKTRTIFWFLRTWSNEWVLCVVLWALPESWQKFVLRYLQSIYSRK